MSRSWHVRPLEPSSEDRRALLHFADGVSRASLAARFHGGLSGLAPELVDRLMDVDHDRREALVAEDGRGFLGVARYDTDTGRPGEAEVAVLVGDGHRRLGIAKGLFRELADLAGRRGVTHFVAAVAHGNHRARGLVSALAPEAVGVLGDGGELVYRIALGDVRQAQGRRGHA